MKRFCYPALDMSLPRISSVAFRVALAIALVVTLYLAITPRIYLAAEILHLKVRHILAFGTLAFLVDFSFSTENFSLKKFLGLMSFGLLIEFIQSFLNYRGPSLLDVVADCVGIAIYWSCYRYLKYVPLLRQRWS